MGSPPASSNSPLVWTCQGENPVNASTSPVIVYKAPFAIYSNAFLKQEWSYLARDHVLRLRKTPPFLVGWLDGNSQLLNVKSGSS
jgi:hypothetical protein